MKAFPIHTKGETTLVTTETRKEAYAKFFLEVKKGNIGLDKIGCIIVAEEDGEEYPFRSIPTLWLMELIPLRVALVTLEKMLDLDSSSDEAATILVDSAKQDMWILDEIERLELQTSEGQAQ